MEQSNQSNQPGQGKPHVSLGQCFDNCRRFYLEVINKGNPKQTSQVGQAFLQAAFPDANNIYPESSLEFMRYSAFAASAYKMAEFAVSGLKNFADASALAGCIRYSVLLCSPELSPVLEKVAKRAADKANHAQGDEQGNDQGENQVKEQSEDRDAELAKLVRDLNAQWRSVSETLHHNIVEFLNIMCTINEAVLLEIMREADERHDEHMKQVVKHLCAAVQEMRQSSYYMLFLHDSGLM